MAGLGCQDTDWVGKNDRGYGRDFTARWALTSYFEHGQRKMWLSRVHFWLLCGRVSGNGFRCNFTVGWAHTTEILTSEVVCTLTYSKQDQCNEGGYGHR